MTTTYEYTEPQKLILAELKSGKYKQCKGNLGFIPINRRRFPEEELVKDTPCYCVAGVICELYCQQVKDIHTEPKTAPLGDACIYLKFASMGACPPAEVREWAGMDKWGMDGVMALNDQQGLTLQEIAERIEADPTRYFNNTPMQPYYHVVVGNIGNVHVSHDEAEARKVFDEYKTKSIEFPNSRCGGEDVTMTKDGEVVLQFFGANPSV